MMLVLPDLSSPGGGPVLKRDEDSQGTVTPPQAISVWQAGMALFKAVVGPSILFLPAAVRTAGLASAAFVTLAMGVVTLWCMLLVLDVSHHLRQRGYTIRGLGDIGFIVGGWKAQIACDVSVVMSQLGFCIGYCVFVGENVQAIIYEAYGGRAGKPGAGADCGIQGVLGDERLFFWIIYVIIPLLTPLTWIRKIKYLSIPTAVASVLVIASVFFLLALFVAHLSYHGSQEVVMFAPNGMLAFIGTAMYAFEGIGVLLPVERSMANPEALPRVMCWTISCIVVLEVAFASMAYCVFGEGTRSIITVSIGNGRISVPGGGHLVAQGLQAAWVLAVLLTFPLQILPAARIIESGFASEARSGCKAAKNFTRTTALMLCVAAATVCYSSVQNMVSVVGAIACVPLSIVYPALFHYCMRSPCRGTAQEALLAAAGPGEPESSSSESGTQLSTSGSQRDFLGSACSDLFIVGLGTLGSVLALAEAIHSWVHTADFSPQVCILTGAGS